MRKEEAPSTPRRSADEELTRLDADIRKLKVIYDQFFAGALPQEPRDQRQHIEQTIRRLTHNGFGKYAQGFRFNALVMRFNSFSELWGRTVRTKEEGDQRAPTVAERFGLRERLVTRCNVRDVARDEEGLRRIHTRMVELNRGKKNTVTFQRFVQTVASQAERLRREAGCDQIELRLVVRDEKIQLKARPGR